VSARHSTVFPKLLVFVCATALALEAQGVQPAIVVSSSATASVGHVDVKPRPDGITLSIAVSAPVTPETSRVSNPDRLVFDFRGCEFKGPNRHIPVNHGPVKEVRLSLYSAHPAVTRVVVDLKEPLSYEVKPPANGIVAVDIPFTKAEIVAAAATAPIRTVEKQQPAAVAPPLRQQEREATKTSAGLQPGAYSLMERARALTVGDLQALEEKAQAGDPEAQTMLALAYHAGVLLKRDDAHAISLLRRAADRDYMAAEETLGIFSETGIGLEKPAPTDALAWYEKAAQQGSMNAATDIGLMYANGKGVTRDTTEAVSWFRRAAEGGDASAQYNLALMYERGEGVPRDYREAVRWLKAGADQNLVPAIVDLAEFSLEPPDSKIPRDTAKAVEYYEKAASLGSVVAQVRLGTIFTKGLPGKVDYEEAANWYRKAADQNDPDGELGLGVSYALGRGVPVDFEEARRLLSAAANRGQVEAQYDLAIMCEEGQGAPADRDMAARYYEMAADRGMVKAQYRYGVMLAKSTESGNNRIAAYKWLMLAQDSIKESSPMLSKVRKSMSSEEIDKAERDVDTWRLAHKHLSH